MVVLLETTMTESWEGAQLFDSNWGVRVDDGLVRRRPVGFSDEDMTKSSGKVRGRNGGTILSRRNFRKVTSTISARV